MHFLSTPNFWAISRFVLPSHFNSEISFPYTSIFTYFLGIAKPPRVVLLSYTGRPFVYCLLFTDLFTLEGMDTSGLQKGATYPEIKARVLEQTGLKVSSLYISQVKQKCGLEVRENRHKAKSENAKQPQCPKEKEDAIVEALKHFQMI